MTDFREEWVRFTGRILEITLSFVRLAAAKDAIKFRVDAPDFVVGNDRLNKGEFIFLRVGTILRDLDISSEFRPSRTGDKTERCPKGTRCFNNTQSCCGSNEVIGDCNGEWRCPDE